GPIRWRTRGSWTSEYQSPRFSRRRHRMESRVPHVEGEVRWYHVARSRAVRRILERSVARWMELHHLVAGPPAGDDAGGGAAGAAIPAPRYRAVLQREGEGHYIHCQIEVVA